VREKMAFKLLKNEMAAQLVVQTFPLIAHFSSSTLWPSEGPHEQRGTGKRRPPGCTTGLLVH